VAGQQSKGEERVEGLESEKTLASDSDNLVWGPALLFNVCVVLNNPPDFSAEISSFVEHEEQFFTVPFFFRY
jgi:hypothetical protein